MNIRKHNLDQWKQDFQFLISVIQALLWLVSLILCLYSIVFQNGVDFIVQLGVPGFRSLEKSDAIFLTAFFSIITILGITIFTFRFWKKHGRVWWIIFGTSLDLIVIWFYFRYWIGSSWWIFICLIPLGLVVLLSSLMLIAITTKVTFLHASLSDSEQLKNLEAPTRANNLLNTLPKDQTSDWDVTKGNDGKWNLLTGTSKWNFFKGTKNNPPTSIDEETKDSWT